MLYSGIDDPVFRLLCASPSVKKLNHHHQCIKAGLFSYDRISNITVKISYGFFPQNLPSSKALIVSTSLSSSNLAAAVLLKFGTRAERGRAVAAIVCVDVWCPYGQYNITVRLFFTGFDLGPRSQTLAVRGLVVSNGHLCFIIILNKHN